MIPLCCLHFCCQRIDHTSTADLVAKYLYGSKKDSPTWFNWRFPAKGLDPLNLFNSLNPLCRISRRIINDSAAIAAEHGRFPFLEVLFATLANSPGRTIQYFSNKDDGHIVIRYGPAFSDKGLNNLVLLAKNKTRGLANSNQTPTIIVHPVKHYPHAFTPRDHLTPESVRKA